MLADTIATYFQAQSLGTFSGADPNIFANFMADTPNACIAIYETGGSEPLKTSGGGAGGALLEFPTFQVVCRSDIRSQVASATQTARNKAHTVFTKLDGAGGLTLSGIVYEFIRALQSPFLLRIDQNDRVYFACNYQATKRLG